MTAHNLSFSFSGGLLVTACESCGANAKANTVDSSAVALPTGSCSPIPTSHSWRVFGERVGFEARAAAICVECGALRVVLVGDGGGLSPMRPLDLTGQCEAAKVAA